MLAGDSKMSYLNEDDVASYFMMVRAGHVIDVNPHNINTEMGILQVTNYDVQWDYSQQKYRRIIKCSTQIRCGEPLNMDPFEVMESSADSEDEECVCDDERKARLLLKEKKIQNKAERKRLKKKRQKERKLQQKELQNPTQDKEIKDIATLDKAEDNPSHDKTKECLDLKDMATALDSESSDYNSDGSSDEENEGLDLTSSFVTKAAEIAKRQLVQKQENKEKKKTPVKEEPKMPEKSACEESHVEKKDTLTAVPTVEDFVKLSTELAMIGNKLATAGNFKLAVKYFTDAIKFNPTEFRLFGNRAFCYEKMQDFDKALNDAEISISMCPGWVKGLFRKGRALAGLKRYEEAARAFKEVVKLDSSCAEAAQELVRVQSLQLMEYGFTQDQSSKALIIHGSVDKAREALSKSNKQSEVFPMVPVPMQQVVNVTGFSPILFAKMTAAAAAAATTTTTPPPPAQDASKSLPESLIPVQSHQTLGKSNDSVPSKADYVVQAPELFPVWVGNLSFSVTETLLVNLFTKVGTVYSLKHLPAKRCAFVNFTQQQHCDAAIRRYHGYELYGSKLAVRFPDRIPPGLNISKSAHKSTNLQDEHFMPNLFVAGRTGVAKPIYPNYKGPCKY
uniref:RRM domain-containing protein n=1 Tax=Neogobius melanostomus TaxID=47308 RepID=A0A8C6U3B2_9GOBI